MTPDQLVALFGCATAINLAVYTLAAIMIVVFRDWMSAMHARMFGLDAAEIRVRYFSYLATYKILLIVFWIAPYLALRIAL